MLFVKVKEIGLDYYTDENNFYLRKCQFSRVRSWYYTTGGVIKILVVIQQ